MKPILFILPYYPKIGGVETCLYSAVDNSKYEIRVFVISEFSFYELEKGVKLPFLKSIFYDYSVVASFYWQVGLIFPLLFFLKRKKFLIFINSTIKYSYLKLISFNISLLISDEVVFDSFNSMKHYKYIYKWPINKKTRVIPFIASIHSVNEKMLFKKNNSFISILRWHKDKGIDRIPELARKLNSKLILYTFPMPLNKNISANIEFKDGRDRKSLETDLISSKVHISLSPLEGFSLIAFEAITFGCIPISLAKTEMSELVESSLNMKANSINELVDLAIYISELPEIKYKQIIKSLRIRIKDMKPFYKSLDLITDECMND